MIINDSDAVQLGRYVELPDLFPEAEVLFEDARLRRHAARPWTRAAIARQLGARWNAAGPVATGPAAASLRSIGRHVMVAGATGTGKTYAQAHLAERLWEAGYSVVVMEGKGEFCDLALELARGRGIPPAQVLLLDPRVPDGAPCLNPFDCGLRPELASRDFRSALEGCYPGFFGPRSRTFLLHACALIAAHRLSVHELSRLVVRPDYREALLRMPVPADSALPVRETASYFGREVANWSRSLLAEAIQPVANKLPEFQQPFLWSLFCGGPGFDLGRLWREQFLAVVRLDRAELGEEAVRLVASILTQLLFRTALRRPGPRPVALFMDELGTAERLAGPVLADLVTQGRSLGLHCVAAFQHAEQLSPDLLATLTANCAVQLVFRQGPDGARRLAAGFAAGTEERLRRVHAEAAGPEGPGGAAASWRHPVCDAHGRRLRLSPQAWASFQPACRRSGDPIGELARLALSCSIRRLYVHRADDGRPEALRAYVAGLRPGPDFSIDGPSLELVVAFPRMRVARAERLTEADAARAWARRLQELPVQHCALRLDGVPRGVTRVADLARPPADPQADQRYCDACARANGRTGAETERTHQAREEAVERLAAGPPAEVAPLGSTGAQRLRPARTDAVQPEEIGEWSDGREQTDATYGGSSGASGHRIASDGSLY